jgi:hypothetical protein
LVREQLFSEAKNEDPVHGILWGTDSEVREK